MKQKEEKETQKKSLLTVQKLVMLLDDFHLKEYKFHLQKINAKLPLKLIETVASKRNTLGSDELCKAIYGKTDARTKHTFNQLGSYCFKLTDYLVRNYPNYLHHNTEKIILWVNQGKIKEANELAEILLETAEKIEDFEIQIFTLKFLSQQAYLHKDFTEGAKFHKRLLEVIDFEKDFTLLGHHFRTQLNAGISKHENEEDLEDKLMFVKKYFEHPSQKIALYAKYIYLNGIYYFKPKEFETPRYYHTFLNNLIDEYNNSAYLVFPYLFDIMSNLLYFKMNAPFFSIESKEGKKQYREYVEHTKSVIFWKHYINLPEIFAISFKASYYLSKYSHITHKKQFQKYIPKEDYLEINDLIIQCEELLEKKSYHEKSQRDIANIYPIYAGLLLVHDEDSIKKSVQILESMLTTYQQMAFGIVTDTIFVCLIMGYFALGKYDQCSDTYNRYMKITKGKVQYEDNDICIHAYYYLSQWLLTERLQYKQKYEKNMQRISNTESSKDLIYSLSTLKAEFGV